MKRLRDMDGDEPLFRHGSELLRGVAPTAPTDMKQRVWRSLQRAPAAARGLRVFALKLAIGAIVALGAGTAGAVIAPRGIAPRWRGVAGAPGGRGPPPARVDRTIAAGAARATAATPPVAPPTVAAPATD